VENVQERVQDLFLLLQTLAITVSAYGNSTVDRPWPYETIPHFENIASPYRRMAGSRLIALLPVVESDQKGEWEAYASATQGWVNESYHDLGILVDPLPIHPAIYDFVDGHATEALQGPFMPLWQMSPPPHSTGIVNYNLFSNEEFSSALELELKAHEALFTKIADLTVFDDGDPNAHESLLVEPVYLDAIDPSSPVVASILVAISWDNIFSDLNRAENHGMHIVLTNTCGDVLTWKLVGGRALFVAKKDSHDPAYDDQEHVEKLTPFLSTTAETSPGYCEYEIHLYPTRDIGDAFYTNRPVTYTTVIVMVFVGLTLCFLVYDRLVQQRQQREQAQTAKSEAIVHSMFPAEVRDRLLEAENTSAAKNLAEEEAREHLGGVKNEGQKVRLKTFLDEEGHVVDSEAQIVNDLKPIADLFPNTTVMFADIAGFTAWSSVREPSQVFTLLETVYKAFDKIAKKRKVFKVETVG